MSLAPFVCWERDGIIPGGMEEGEKEEEEEEEESKTRMSKRKKERMEGNKGDNCQGVCMFQENKRMLPGTHL